MADKMLKDLTKDTKAAASDSLMIWQGSNNARQISKADFLSEITSAHNSLLVQKEASISIQAPAGTVTSTSVSVSKSADQTVIPLFVATQIHGLTATNLFMSDSTTIQVRVDNLTSSTISGTIAVKYLLVKSV